MNKDLKYLNDNKFFDVKGFLNYITYKYQEYDSIFGRKIIMNILNEAASHWNYEDMEFITRVSLMLNVDIIEVKLFADPLMIHTPSNNDKLLRKYELVDNMEKYLVNRGVDFEKLVLLIIQVSMKNIISISDILMN